MHNILENIFLSRELYQTILAPVCIKHEMSHAEMVTLLFLAGNPELNTATDVVKGRRLTKSAVSMAVRSLNEKGLISGEFIDGNHRSIHLNVCDEAKHIIEEGQAAQNEFFAVMLDGFSETEKENLKDCLKRVSANIKTYHDAKK